ncbi:alpha/beta fold hydrolase [soil metagenome]
MGPGNVLPLVLRIRRSESAWEGQMDLPAHGVFDSTVGLGLLGDSLRIEMGRLGASFAGVLAAADTVTGTWSQAGLTLPLSLVRQSPDPQRRRPQDPSGVLPYRVQDVTFRSTADSLRISGILTLPAGAQPRAAVVLLGGSGPQDRDAAIAGHRPFAVIADHLARSGIAVLRYDERGVGGSTGDFSTATTLDFADDAQAAVDFLATHFDVVGSPIGVIGHSEGGIVAPLVANRSASVSFVVLLAAPGVSMREIALAQAGDMTRAQGMSAAWVRDHVAMVEAVFDLFALDLPAMDLAPRIRPLLERSQADSPWPEPVRSARIDHALATYLSPWAQFAFRYDPGPALRALRVPVLALNGDLDAQVRAVPNLAAIAAAVADGGSGSAVTAVLPGLNHYFQTAVTGALDEYATIEETFAPAALTRISDWILSVDLVLRR